MGENSKIEWTDHTFNPWSGCQKVSPGCQHCYAESQAKLNPTTLGVWGPQGTRVRMSDAYWRKPLKWNKQAWEQCIDCGWRGPHSETHDFCPACDGENLKPARQRVFCASMADVFEDRPELAPWRTDLLELIAFTPNLDWLLLSKRPENVLPFVEAAAYDLLMQGKPRSSERWRQWLNGDGLFNVWTGATVENQEQAKRIPELLKISGKHFLSMEPLLEGIDLEMWLGDLVEDDDGAPYPSKIDWVIAGGESGPAARPAHPDWFRSIRDECVWAGVPFFFKQWGEWLPGSHFSITEHTDMSRIMQFGDGQIMQRVGKKAAGRLLNGIEWNQVPGEVTGATAAG